MNFNQRQILQKTVLNRLEYCTWFIDAKLTFQAIKKQKNKR